MVVVVVVIVMMMIVIMVEQLALRNAPAQLRLNGIVVLFINYIVDGIAVN